MDTLHALVFVKISAIQPRYLRVLNHRCEDQSVIVVKSVRAEVAELTLG